MALLTGVRPPWCLAPRLWQALGLSLALLALRLSIAFDLGFGDSEALYACYALYPQPGYLDHPGLIGLLLRVLGGGALPSPSMAHAASALVATLVPWLGAIAVRASGETWERSTGAVLALALVPELSVGLFGVTPDLPLAVLWLTALALAAYLSREALSQPKSHRVLLAWLCLGLSLGLATLAKVSGCLLALGLVAASLTPGTRAVWRSFGPWGAVGCALVVVAPLVHWEASQDFPMLTHRLVTTQRASGFSLRYLLKFIGGQLVYVTPPYLIAAFVLFRDLNRRRRGDRFSNLLFYSAVIPLVPLAVLSLWSARAEPHWVAPPLLALGVHAARQDLISKRLGVTALVTGAALTLLVWMSVKTDVYIRLATSSVGQALGGYRPRYDLTNDLYAWGPGRQLLEQAVNEVITKKGRVPRVVGTPHWMVCAQAQAAMGDRLRVGCHSPLPSDFDRWLPPEEWRQAQIVLLVQDSRYPVDPALAFPARRVGSKWSTQIRRGGQVVRTIRISELELTEGVAQAGARRHSGYSAAAAPAGR